MRKVLLAVLWQTPVHVCPNTPAPADTRLADRLPLRVLVAEDNPVTP